MGFIKDFGECIDDVEEGVENIIEKGEEIIKK